MSVLKKFLVFAVCIFVILFCFRAFGLVKCTVAQYDLKRPTHFSFVTGNCMVDAGNGSRVYLKSLRGYGDEGADQ